MVANPQLADRHIDGPEGQKIHLFKFPAECLRQVIFGIRMPDDQRRKIADLIEDRYSDVELFKAVLNQERFDLDVVHIA